MNQPTGRAAEIWIGQRPPPPFIIDGGITLLEPAWPARRASQTIRSNSAHRIVGSLSQSIDCLSSAFQSHA